MIIPTIFTMAFNESLLLQFMIDHYRSRFPGCHIVLHDNESTDNTVEIALKNNCEVINYSTNAQIDDFKLRELKNNCWKQAKTDWVLVCDVDELFNINAEQLEKEDSQGFTLVRSEGYTMMNMEPNYDFHKITHGWRDTQYDKAFLFNKKYILNVNYECGAHRAHPEGIVKMTDNAYKLYHWRFIHPDLTIARNKISAPRMSQINLRNGMGAYLLESEETTRQAFITNQKRSVKII